MFCVWKSSKIANPWRFQLGKSDMGCFGDVQPESCSFKIRPSQVGYLHPAAKVYKTLHFPNRFGARHPLGFVCRLNSQENSENPPGATKTLRASDQKVGTPPANAKIGSTLWPLACLERMALQVGQQGGGVPRRPHGFQVKDFGHPLWQVAWSPVWRLGVPEKIVTSTRASYPHPPIWL